MGETGVTSSPELRLPEGEGYVLGVNTMVVV